MTYELIQVRTSNTVACFSSQKEADAALAQLRASDDQFAATLEVVAFDDEGIVVEEEAENGAAHEAEVVPAFHPGRSQPA